MIDVADVIHQFESLQSDRSNWNTTWQEIAEYMGPRRADFTMEWVRGANRRNAILDGSPEQAAERFSAGLHNIITPEGQPWFYLVASDEGLNRDRDVAFWLEDTSKRMYRVFNSPSSNFHPSAHELYADEGLFGNAVMFIGDRPGVGPFFQSHFIGECYFEANDDGKVDTLFRGFKYNAKQFLQAFGSKNASSGIMTSYSKKDGKLFKMLHATRPRRKRVFGRNDGRNKAWESVYITLDDRGLISEGGFDGFPFVTPRWEVSSSETYGRGPGARALPDVKMLNTMERTVLKALQQQADPPLDVPEDGYLNRPRLMPGGLNYRRIGYSINERIMPVMQGQRVDLADAKMEQKRDLIRRAFYLDVLELPGPIAQDGDVLHMSATETAIRQRDRLGVLGPIFSRQKTEYLGPMVFRTLTLMVQAGMTLPVPEQLQGANIEAEYSSPLAVAQQSGEVGSILQAVEAVRPIAEFQPGILDRFNGDNIVGIISRALRTPIEAIRSDEEIAEIRAAQEEERQKDKQAQMDKMGAGTLKDLAAAAPPGG